MSQEACPLIINSFEMLTIPMERGGEGGHLVETFADTPTGNC